MADVIAISVARAKCGMFEVTLLRLAAALRHALAPPPVRIPSATRSSIDVLVGNVSNIDRRTMRQRIVNVTYMGTEHINVSSFAQTVQHARPASSRGLTPGATHGTM